MNFQCQFLHLFSTSKNIQSFSVKGYIRFDRKKYRKGAKKKLCWNLPRSFHNHKSTTMIVYKEKVISYKLITYHSTNDKNIESLLPVMCKMKLANFLL